jgi:predicted CoA-binding protein
VARGPGALSLNGQPTAQVKAILARKTPDTRIAVVGASNASHKYGNIIVKNLKAKGYAVYPVNLREQTIAGLPVSATLAELPDPVEMVVYVTPPEVTRQVLAEQARLGLQAVAWLQDGAFDDAALAYAEAASFPVVHHACVMVVSNY